MTAKRGTSPNSPLPDRDLDFSNEFELWQEIEDLRNHIKTLPWWRIKWRSNVEKKIRKLEEDHLYLIRLKTLDSRRLTPPFSKGTSALLWDQVNLMGAISPVSAVVSVSNPPLIGATGSPYSHNKELIDQITKLLKQNHKHGATMIV